MYRCAAIERVEVLKDGAFLLIAPLSILYMLVAGGALVAVIAIVYLAGALVFMDRFMPNTTIMGKDVSLKTTAEVQDLLTDVAKSYQLRDRKSVV